MQIIYQAVHTVTLHLRGFPLEGNALAKTAPVNPNCDRHPGIRQRELYTDRMTRLQATADSVLRRVVSPIAAWRAVFLDMTGSAAHSLSLSHPQAYLVSASLLALLGYASLIVFPLLVLMGLVNLYDAMLGVNQADWLRALVWLSIAVASAPVCYRLYLFRAAVPAGQPLNEQNAPGLLQLIAEITKNFEGPVIDRVVLSDQFELKVEKTPLIPFPVLFRTTLVVGLPFIQYMSPGKFQCALAGRLGQYSKRYNRLVNWLNQMRTVWPLYCNRNGYRGVGHQPVSWFFSIYAPIYNAFTVPAARLDELAADTYSMCLFSDESVLDMVTTCMVCKLYLELKYWPVVKKYSEKNTRIRGMLHSGMSNVLRAGLQPDVIDYWMEKALAYEPQSDDPEPSLAQRVNNIGFTGASMDASAVDSAGKALIIENVA